MFVPLFYSKPKDDKGAPHILEHLICCGSEKYPIRDPFMSMSKRSINTYMNAWTGNDFICFPFSSMNQTDFENLLKVYLDLIFKPTLREIDFLQEGHRLDLEDRNNINSNIIYKGVVFNEMKGYYT